MSSSNLEKKIIKCTIYFQFGNEKNVLFCAINSFYKKNTVFVIFFGDQYYLWIKRIISEVLLRFFSSSDEYLVLIKWVS
jgi:spore coat polysaccharide biosynthesis protein SpsF (cytidylyltransferase family)